MKKCAQNPNQHKRRQGKLTVNGVILEKHEMSTVAFLLDLGKDIELIKPSLTPRTKNADLYMDGLEWEMKCPFINSRRAIERLFYKAGLQSENIIMDLRQIKCAENKAKNILLRCFRESRSARKLLIIDSQQTYSIYHKK